MEGASSWFSNIYLSIGLVISVGLICLFVLANKPFNTNSIQTNHSTISFKKKYSPQGFKKRLKI